MNAIIIFLILTSELYAQCDIGYYQKLIESPEKFAVVAVGTFTKPLSGKIYKETLELKKIWKFPSEQRVLHLPHALECGFRPSKLNDSYLLISTTESFRIQGLDTASFGFFKLNSKQVKEVVSKMAKYQTEKLKSILAVL